VYAADLCWSEPQQICKVFSLCGRHVTLFTESSFQLVSLRFAEQNSTLFLATTNRRRRRRLLLLLVVVVMLVMSLMMKRVESGAGQLLTVRIRLLGLSVGVVVRRSCVVDLGRLGANVFNTSSPHCMTTVKSTCPSRSQL